MSLLTVFNALSAYPDISAMVTLRDMHAFLELAGHLRERIALALHSSATAPPDTLPVSVHGFLKDALSVSDDSVKLLWQASKDQIWSSSGREAGLAYYPLFLQFGRPYGIGFRDLYPPTRRCIDPRCLVIDPHTGQHHQAELGAERVYDAVLFSHDVGAIPVHNVSLYCRSCKTRYHHNYFIHENATTRTYYGGVPAIIQVSQKAFATAELCERFANSMMCAWVSGLNLARMYNLTFEVPDISWPHSLELQAEQVWDAFLTHSLLRQHHEDGALLQLAHQAPSHAERLRPALEARNARFSGPGREMWEHACKSCCKEVTHDDGTSGILRSVVTDGITLGHPCCAVHDCENDLPNAHAMYCTVHESLQSLCVAIDNGVRCQNARAPSSRVCRLPEHRTLEAHYQERGRALFQLKKSLESLHVSQTADGLSGPSQSSSEPGVDNAAAHEGIGDEGLVELTAEGQETSGALDAPPAVAENGGTNVAAASADARPACPDKPESGNRKLRARFGQRRTHNEELIVASCGMILVRKTFFGSESPRKVVQLWKDSFPTPKSRPGVIWMDLNCQIAKHLACQGDHTFDDCAKPVDVFHFRVKHKAGDEFCQQYCNPARWKVLMTPDGKWLFNSSAAEQANVWMGGFRAIVRQMRKDRYNFFLDEMIKRRNRFILAEQVRKNENPVFMPKEELFAL